MEMEREEATVESIIEMIDKVIDRIRRIRLAPEEESKRKRALNTLEGVKLILSAVCDPKTTPTWWEQPGR